MSAPVPMLRVRARRLRREQTAAERKLWARLRARQVDGAKFRRQHPIGRYIADFCCPEHGVVIELDGGQHADGPPPLNLTFSPQGRRKRWG